MQKITRFSLIIALALAAVSCGNSSKKERDGGLTDKKVELEKLKIEKTKTEEKIKGLETEIAKLDTGAGKTLQAKLVSIVPVQVQKFTHYIDLQGKIDAENISYVTPRGGPGQVRAIFVKKGDMVHKGQLILKLDDAVQRQAVITSRQSMASVRTQLELAKTIYQRQKNLWDQNIGTEVQLLQAKSNVEGLENQLKTMAESVKSAQEYVNLTNVYSDVSGIADAVDVHVGETFTGAPMNQSNAPSGIKIVYTSALKVVADVPENYLTRVKKGTKVQLVVPDLNKTFNSTISVLNQSINTSSRGFTAEAKMPYDAIIKPGQTAVMKLLDYAAENVVVIPVNVVQSDESSKYVYVLEKRGDGKQIAKRKTVIIGEVYGDNVEIKSGLTTGDQIITEGYQTLYEGQVVTTELK